MTATERLCRGCMHLRPASRFYQDRHATCKLCRDRRRILALEGKKLPKVTKPPRYPLGALLRATGASTIQDLMVTLADRGAPHRLSRLKNWKERGVDERNADRLAVAIGQHPALVWPEWWDYGLLIKEESDG